MRSLLFVPADSERKLARGLESGADALILDLEDLVAAANRPTARKLAREFLEAHGPDRIRRYVRINPLASGLALDDLAATVAGRPDGILLPKCTPEEVRTADHYLSAFEAAAGRRSAQPALSRSPPRRRRRCSRSAATPAPRRGSRRSPGAPRTWPPASAATTARSTATMTARTSWPARCACWRHPPPGSSAIDTIYTDFKDEAGLKAECAAARRSGFAAKMAIHPAQLAAINEAFSVSAAERDWAERVIAAFAANPDAGTLALDGKMIDKPHLVLARRLLGLAPG